MYTSNWFSCSFPYKYIFLYKSSTSTNLAVLIIHFGSKFLFASSYSEFKEYNALFLIKECKYYRVYITCTELMYVILYKFISCTRANFRNVQLMEQLTERNWSCHSSSNHFCKIIFSDKYFVKFFHHHENRKI